MLGFLHKPTPQQSLAHGEFVCAKKACISFKFYHQIWCGIPAWGYCFITLSFWIIKKPPPSHFCRELSRTEVRYYRFMQRETVIFTQRIARLFPNFCFISYLTSFLTHPTHFSPPALRPPQLQSIPPSIPAILLLFSYHFIPMLQAWSRRR